MPKPEVKSGIDQLRDIRDYLNQVIERDTEFGPNVWHYDFECSPGKAPRVIMTRIVDRLAKLIDEASPADQQRMYLACLDIRYKWPT